MYDFSPEDLMVFMRKFLDGRGLEITDRDELMEAICEHFMEINPDYEYDEYAEEE